MPGFSLDEYQEVLSELSEEIREYGDARSVFGLSTESLNQLAVAHRELRDEQVKLNRNVGDNTLRLEAVVDKSERSVVQTRIALESIEKQVEIVWQGVSEIEKLVEKSHSEMTTELGGFRKEVDGFSEETTDTLRNLEEKVSALSGAMEAIHADVRKGNAISGQALTISYVVAGVTAVILILLLAGLFI